MYCLSSCLSFCESLVMSPARLMTDSPGVLLILGKLVLPPSGNKLTPSKSIMFSGNVEPFGVPICRVVWGVGSKFVQEFPKLMS